MGLEAIYLGVRAEDGAAGFLKRLGYRIVERNFRSKMGEIDIIAWDGEVLVFVEVKSRSAGLFGLPQEAVGPPKRRKIIKTAMFYILRKGLDCPMRFDVIAMKEGAIEHIPNAFDGTGRG